MQRINDSTVRLSEDEQLIGDFYSYLREEKGKTREQALATLYRVSALAGRMDAETPVVTDQLLDYLDDIGQPELIPVPEGKAPRNAWGGLYADSNGNWFSPEAEQDWMDSHTFHRRGPA